MAIYNVLACALKPVLESSRSHDDQLNVVSYRHVSTGSHKPTQRSPACSVQATGSTSLKPRTTRVQRTRNGVCNRQITEYPRGAYTQRGSHQSIHGLPACGVHATGSTSVKARIIHVQPSRYGVHTSQVRSYPRVSALRGPRKSKHGLPTWSASYGVYTSPSTDYSRKQRIHWPIK